MNVHAVRSCIALCNRFACYLQLTAIVFCSYKTTLLYDNRLMFLQLNRNGLPTSGPAGSQRHEFVNMRHIYTEISNSKRKIMPCEVLPELSTIHCLCLVKTVST